MEKSKNKAAVAIAILFELIIVATLIVSGLRGSKKNVFLSVLAALSILIPFIISWAAKRKRVILPEGFNLIVLCFVIGAQYFGELQSFYYRFWWWDLLLHGVFGAYAAVVGIYITKGIIEKAQDYTERRYLLFISIFAFSFSMTLGVLWELFEFSGDYLFKSNMMKEGLMDTMTDLLVSTGTALGYAVIYYLRKRNSNYNTY